MRPLALLLLVLAVMLGTSSASADMDLPGPVFRFNYKVKPGAVDCPMEADARGLFTITFGYDPFSPDAQRTLFVVASRRAGGVHVDLSVRDAAGAVQWEDSYEGNVHCWGAILTAAFKAEMEFVPPPAPPVCPALPSPPEPAPPCAPAVQHAPALPKKRHPRSTPPRGQPPSSPLQFEMTAGIAGAYGLPPGVSLGPVLSFGASLPWLSVGIGVGGRFAVSEDLGGGIVARSSAFTGEAFACVPRKWFLGCGLVQIGHLGIHPATKIAQIDADPAFAGIGLRAAGQWPIAGRYRIRPYVDAVVPTGTGVKFAHRTSVDNTELAWRSPFVFGVIGIAMVVALP